MIKIKYIVTEHGDFAIFTALSSHDDVARSLHGKPVGAGFCHIENGKFVCNGTSFSLSLASRGLEDSIIINKCLL